MVESAAKSRKDAAPTRHVFAALALGAIVLAVGMMCVQWLGRQFDARYHSCLNATVEVYRQLDQAEQSLWSVDAASMTAAIDKSSEQLEAANTLIDRMIHGDPESGRDSVPTSDAGLVDALQAIKSRGSETVVQIQGGRLLQDTGAVDEWKGACTRSVREIAESMRKVQEGVTRSVSKEMRVVQRSEWLILMCFVLLMVMAGRAVWRWMRFYWEAEEALRVSEEKYRSLFESTSDAVMLLDEKRTYDCNPAALKIFGMDTAEEFCRNHPADLSPPAQPNGISSVEVASERIAQAHREGSCRFEWMHRRKDGTEFPCEVALSTAVVAGRRVCHAITRDMTEHKAAERLLQANEEKLRTIMESALDAVIMMDSTGKATHWNPAAERIFGYSSDEIIGREIHPILAPLRSQDTAAKGLPTFFHDGTGAFLEQIVELQAVRKGGIEFPVEVTVSPIRVENSWWAVAIARDISDRKKVEVALRQSHEELKAIYDGMVDGLLIADLETRRFESANKAMCHMLGYSQRELLQFSLNDIHPESDVARVNELFDALAQESLTEAAAVPVLCKDGTIFYADIAAARVVYHNRECVIGFFHDITERIQAAETLRSEQKSLRRLLKAHDQERQLIAYEIHDGPAQQLVAAIMQCQAVEGSTSASPDDVSETLSDVLRSLRRALNEMRRLISGVRPPLLDELGVVSAIRGLVHETTTEDGPEIELRASEEFDRLDPAIENSIYRIVQESLTNACRHSNSRNVRIELSQLSGLVRIDIRDWGIGFNPGSIDEKRYGLAGIRERVRLLGGRVRIDSKEGEGTRILVQLPVHYAESKEDI